MEWLEANILKMVQGKTTGESVPYSCAAKAHWCSWGLRAGQYSESTLRKNVENLNTTNVSVYTLHMSLLQSGVELQTSRAAMTLKGPSLDDVMLDTPGQCAVIQPISAPTRAMPISVDPWVRDPSQLKLNQHQRIGLIGRPMCAEPYYRQCENWIPSRE